MVNEHLRPLWQLDWLSQLPQDQPCPALQVSTCVPAVLQSEEHLKGNLYKLKPLMTASLSSPAPPSFSGDLGQAWPRWLGLSDWRGRATLLKECLVHCESRTTFVECNKMNEMSDSMNGMLRSLWESAQDKVGREYGEASVGIGSRNA